MVIKTECSENLSQKSVKKYKIKVKIHGQNAHRLFYDFKNKLVQQLNAPEKNVLTL